MPSSFWGSPAYHVGPYGVPARPGVLDRVLQLTDIGTNLFGLYQQHKDKSLQDVVKKLGVGRALYGDQPMPVSDEMGGKIEKATGFSLPKVSEQDRQQNLQQIISSGKATVPGRELTDPAIAEAQAPRVGSYAPLPGEAPKTLEAAMLKNLQRTGQATPQNLQKMWMAQHGKQAHRYHVPGVGLVDEGGNVIVDEPEQSTTLYDEATGQTKQVKGKNVKVTHPWVSPLDVVREREKGIQNRESTVLGDEDGVPVPYKYKGPVKSMPKAPQGVTFVTPEPGKTYPPGAKPMPTDKGGMTEDKAMKMAWDRMKINPEYKYMPADQQTAKQKEIANQIMAEQGKGGKGAAPQPTKPSYTAEQVEAEYQKGLKEGRDPAAMKAKRDQLLQGLGGQ